MYVGSMYLIETGILFALQWLVICSFRYGPTSASSLLPPASVSPVPEMIVSPQPSATTTTTYFCLCSTAAMCSRSFGSETSISGRRQTSTCLAASVAVAAIQPQCRPMSLTRPMQFAFVVASTYAESMACFASSAAVSKPKVLSTSVMSLSMVLGTPTTAHSWPISVIASKVCIAPLCVPSPPSTKYCRIFRFCRVFAISVCGGFPRSLTSTLPPSMWMSCT
mmetsp:Transcript_43834/g.135785  ORF Transcript_43834/g.135785 Transcript_43834/m.135785 type:complete len:222 (+) Transcript_43834:149-814(+)